MPAPTIAGDASAMVLRGKGKIVGWVVKVGERKLIKKAAIYSEKQMALLLGKGYNVLVREGRQVAKRIARNVWGKDTLHHAGHIIKKTGKMGRPHYQPLRHAVGRAGEKGWHIFYSAVPIVFFTTDVEASAIYDDKYPGRSVANYLTVTQYVGEDSWLSYLDWVNPLELVAIGGDIGRDFDRERTKELKAVVFTRRSPKGSVQTYEVNPQGRLVRVIVVSGEGKRKEFSAQQYYELLGKSMEKLPQSEEGSKDGSHHSNYARTFDAESRLCYSKRGTSYDHATGWFYLPAAQIDKLAKHGAFYANINRSIEYVYIIAPADFRILLGQPGFLLQSQEVKQYLASSDKVTLIEGWFTQRVAAGIMDRAEIGAEE
ncbi:MAG: hypothetical protein MJE77_03845 [Proteobacteria bacterium]|nr:hypothetical protein [Pseudomonadota bacterium]